MKDEDKTKEQIVDELIELRQRITEIEEMAKRKQAEEAPRESEKRFRDLFENSPDAMFVEDLDGNVLDVNPAACRLHGTGREDLIGKNVLELVPPDKREEVARDFLKLVDGERDHVEGFSLTKDGRLVPVEIRASRIDYSGKPAILLDVRDITERKRTEETLRRYAQRLEALLMENARLFEAEQRRAEQFRVISEVGRRITSILAVDELLGEIVRLVKETLGYYLVGIGLIEGDELIFKAGAGSIWETPGFQPPRLKVGREGITGWVAQSGEPLLVPDVSREPRYYFMPQAGEIRSELAVPLKTKEAVIGVLHVQSDHLNAFDQSDLVVLQSLAHQAAIVIENARLYEEEHRRSLQRKTIAEVGRTIAAILDLDTLLSRVVDLIAQNFGYYFVHVFEVDAEAGYVVFKAGTGEAGRLLKEERNRLRIGEEGIIGWVAYSGQPLMVNDTDKEPRYYFHPALADTRSELAVPIRLGEKIIGVLDVQSEEPNAFDESDLATLETLADQLAIAIENARLYEQAERSAAAAERSRLARELHDAVTQTLFSASLIAEVLPRLWERDQDEGQRRLEELRQLTRGALAEMRTLLLELRPAALTEVGLGDLLRQLAEATTGRARVPVTVTVEGQHNLPPDVQVALYRIAHEALNNVAKHAGASQAAVSLRCTPSFPPDLGEEQGGGVELRISDDGRGFDPSRVPPEHLGLGIMRERAEAIGATLRVESQPGHGTQVVVVWEEEGRGTREEGQETEDAF